MAEYQNEAKRMKMDNGVEVLHNGKDSSSTNTNLCASIIHKLYLDEKTADIHFSFGANGIERVPAHKLILSTGSNVFETMFHGSLPEGDVVNIVSGDSSAFKEFLQFFYLDDITMTSDNIAQVINFVQQYGIERCMVQCIDFLKNTMTNNDVCKAYHLALQFNLDDLKRFCERKISGNAEDVLKTDDFLNCDRTVLQHILKMDSLLCEETNIFDACIAWAKKSCEKKGQDAGIVKNLRKQLSGEMRFIHFRRMKFEDFVSRNAEYFDLFSITDVRDILQIIANKEFKSDLFTTKPLSYEIFTWDEKRVFECSLSDKLRPGFDPFRQTKDSFTFSCNKPLLLKRIKLAKVKFTRQAIFGRDSRDPDTIKIDLFQIYHGKFTEESLFKANFCMSSEEDIFVEFDKPIIIHPKRSYKIVMSSAHNGQFNIATANGTVELGALQIMFNGCGLVSAMFFNRI
ncbi:BTB/POZ domain-containing protein 3-like [Bradysia coprophila]|uniref:BTB/POZ domain-containing protein 3-like n=1 Tax=Bradysia coprophila TaxID=38358 RepID=UPI00187DD503|nr:BTB/POZ domain-containing protein 3-like [Bradysia coprophila]XP_037033571.1 BTB/POZ domain-containing protein 3-like [Bradysia coprophila]